jgi:TRAP-type C4-dicarboxylate transport system permease small subunit
MSKRFSIDRFLELTLENLATIILALVNFWIFVGVIFRYLLKIPQGNIGELPIYLMMLTVWLAGALNSKTDTHISLKILEWVVKDKKTINYINLTLRFLSVFTLLFFSYLSFKYLQYNIESKATSAALRFPIWWFILIIFVGVLLMTYYTIGLLIKDLKRIRGVQ